jgi:putative flippase GtrA
LQLLRYLLVGGIAFCADAGALFLLKEAGLHYLLAAAFAFLVGLTVNFLLSKRFVFTEDARFVGRAGEFAAYGLIGLAGLGITELVMYLCTGVFGLYYMLSKIVSAAIVLLWNFFARKFFLYR